VIPSRVNGEACDRLMTLFCWGCALTLTLVLAAILGFLFFKGWHVLGPKLIFGEVRPLDALLFKKRVFSGLFPAALGTFCLICLAVGTALPLGLACGIYMAEYASNRVKSFFSLMVDILAAIPSIVVGLFGFSITVFLHHYFGGRILPCLGISGIALAFLVLPYIVKTTRIALEQIPLEIRMTGLSLGASPLQNLRHVLIPASLSDIMAGIVLAIGRCAEDTAVIMLTGVVATAGVPKSLFSPFEALPFFIYYTASEYSDPAELEAAYGAALILLAICTGLFIISFQIKRRYNSFN